jgi:hypothetical protein
VAFGAGQASEGVELVIRRGQEKPVSNGAVGGQFKVQTAKEHLTSKVSLTLQSVHKQS